MQCKARAECLVAYRGSLMFVPGMTMPVVHVQASTEACQTIECHLSIRFYVILCRRLGSRNELSSVRKRENKREKNETNKKKKRETIKRKKERKKKQEKRRRRKQKKKKKKKTKQKKRKRKTKRNKHDFAMGSAIAEVTVRSRRTLRHCSRTRAFGTLQQNMIPREIWKNLQTV